MNVIRNRTGIVTAIGLALAVGAGTQTHAADARPMPDPTHADPIHPDPIQHEATMTMHASGTFDVTLTPQAPGAPGDGPAVARMLLDKQFHGDLTAISSGQMLAFTTDVAGSAGYVAMERVSGTLHGRSGSFALQHSGTMTRGAPQLSVTVVPDSGSGGLVGLAGTMTIRIVDGKHLYTFDYTLAAAD